MKLQLDTTNKTIKIEEKVKLSKLIETLKKLLPNNEWKEFTLETNTTISYWSSPVIVKEYVPTPVYPKPWNPWQPWYYSTSGSSGSLLNRNVTSSLKAESSYQLKAGVYNVEV